ncbi:MULTISPECIES: hypothetical protein [unclassified Streptomyces]|uniref:hypothetical protein n=1 Tax=unclassified Streptomyces TaxID=2593676 RepID=UPI00224E780A|nr:MULTISPECIES: hypothetical protein [unclassified Streptomyces]MCX4871071.1 hypothetical protein [Streptomyces sp. NBC_00906]MCX4902701.1 hypothetical protein [Streptomyces sp. NBC_00892]
MSGVDRQELAVRLKEIFDRDVQAGRQPYRRAMQVGLEEDLVTRILNGQFLPNRGRLDTLLDSVLISDEERMELQAIRSSIYQGVQAGRGEGAARTVLRREPYVPKFGQPDPTGVSSPLELQQAMQAARVWGGRPSLRQLERRSGGVLRRSTVSDMLRGEPSVPDYDRYLAFLRACGIDDVGLNAWVFTWRRLSAQKQPKIAAWMGGMTLA